MQVTEGLHPNVITYAAAMAACKNRLAVINAHICHDYIHTSFFSSFLSIYHCLFPLAFSYTLLILQFHSKRYLSHSSISPELFYHATSHFHPTYPSPTRSVPPRPLSIRPLTVIALLERMKKENVVPNTIVLTTAIDSLAREGGGIHTGNSDQQ